VESVTVTIAAVNWKLREITRDSQFFAHFYDLVEEAHNRGANVIVFPELIILELLHLEPKLRQTDVPRYLIQFSDSIEEWIQRISENSGLVLVGGSHFKETPEGIVNACAVGHPSLGLVTGAKNNLTQYEKEIWGLATGSSLVQIPDRRLGVTICYDSEFPESGRALAEQAVTIQCVPAFTETMHGFHRVRWSCHARSVENQIFVVHSSLVGTLGREPVPTAVGSSAILAPPIPPFPENGVLAETPMDEEQIVVYDLNLEQLDDARLTGDVRNWHDRSASNWKMGTSL
jgi:predicted amidohydrolase